MYLYLCIYVRTHVCMYEYMCVCSSTGFPRTPTFKDRMRKKGVCASMWRAEKRFRFWVRRMVKAQWFYWFVIVLVFFNTVFVAIEYHKQPQFITDFVCKCFRMFLIVFLFETY